MEGHLYLPPYKYCSIDFITDIVKGKRMVLESKDVVMRHLPRIKRLRTEDLVNFLVHGTECEEFLPSNYREVVLYRDWVGNLCNSLNQIGFNDFVENKLISRQQKIIEKKNLSIQVLPKFEKLFKTSLMISTHKGKSNLMMNRTNRYKKEEEIKERDYEKAEQLSAIKTLKQEVVYLKEELEVVNSKKDEADKHAHMIHKLLEQNIIDEDGNLIQEEK